MPKPLAHTARTATSCSSCVMRTHCVPSGLRSEDMIEIDQIVTSRRRIKRGEHLYRAGDPFTGIFAFRTGFFKSYVESEDGRTHVTSFQMAGDVCGLDGIEEDRYTQNVVALEDGEVCTITYAQVESVSSRIPGFQRYLYRVMLRGDVPV